MGRHTAFEPDDPTAGPTGGFAEYLDIAAVRADDELLERVRTDFTAGHDLFASPVDVLPGLWSSGPVASDAVETLLAGWQDELSALPMPATPSLGQADWALRKGRRQGLRPMIAVAAAICALLIGSAGVGSRLARPGDVLWPLTRVLWSDRVASAKAEEKVTTQLKVASNALGAGDPTGASTALTLVPVALPEVQSVDGHDRLSAAYVELKDQVSSRMDSTPSSDPSSTSIRLGSATSGADPTSRLPIPHLGSRTPTPAVAAPTPTTRQNPGPSGTTTTPAGPTISTPPFSTPTTGHQPPGGPVTSGPPSESQSTPTTNPVTTAATPTVDPTPDPDPSPSSSSDPTTPTPETSLTPVTTAVASDPTDSTTTTSTTTPTPSTDLGQSDGLPSDGLPSGGQQPEGAAG